MKIYFPMSADILTPGHIKCLEWLRDYQSQKHPSIYIGLLSDKALEGYKKTIVSYKDREYIMEAIARGITKWGISCAYVVKQDSLNPVENIKKYKCVAVASGDGWEPEELEAIKKLGLLKIDIDFPKKWSSTKIKEKIHAPKVHT